MVFTFVILHYKTYDDTCECIDSINRLNDSSEVVVIDNGSNNGSFEKLKDKYENTRIHFIDNDKNLGFAAANNIGYKYAKDSLKSDFIATINNDIVVKSKDLIKQFIENWKSDNYYIAGPDLISLDGRVHQNPGEIIEFKKEDIIPTVLKYRVAYLLSKIGFYKYLNRYSTRISSNENVEYKKKQYNVQLYGSFLVYSPTYIKKEDYAFYPGTFLYNEETILHYICKAKNYLVAYYPDIVAIHKGAVSVNSTNSSQKKIYEFRLKHMADSLLILKKAMEEFPIKDKNN